MNKKLNPNYMHSNNKQLSREENIALHIDFLLKHPDVVLLRDLKVFGQKIEDKNFFMQVLNKKPTFYEFINDKYKLDQDVLEIALQDYKNFFHLPEQEKDVRFQDWYKKNKTRLDPSQVKKLSIEHRVIVVNDNPSLLVQLLSNNNDEFLPLVKDVLKNKPYDFLKDLDTKSRKELTKDGNVEYIKEQLTDALNDYVYIYHINNSYENNLFFLLRFDEELTDKLENNPSYRVSVSANKYREIGVKLFEEYLEQMLERYRGDNKEGSYSKFMLNEERIEHSLQSAKMQLNKQKAAHYPDDLLGYIKSKHLAETLQAKLDPNAHKNAYSNNRKI